MKTNCKVCDKEFEARKCDLKRGHSKYCSRSCYGKSDSVQRPRKPNVECAYCQEAFYKAKSKRLKSKSGLFFCCREHKDLAQRLEGIEAIQPAHYGNSGAVYRRIGFSAHGKVCSGCGYSKYTEVLVVHHKDRDRTNNTSSNL